jgi:hypothetical protein
MTASCTLGRLQVQTLGSCASEGTELRARESHSVEFACGDTAGFSPLDWLDWMYLGYTAACSFIHASTASMSSTRPAHGVGHDEVEVRFSQVLANQSLTTGVRRDRQEGAVGRSDSHRIARVAACKLLPKRQARLLSTGVSMALERPRQQMIGYEI